MAARANLQNFRDNATEIAPPPATISSRNLHIRFSCEKITLIHHLIFSTFIKSKKRNSYNILIIGDEVFARTPQRDTATENHNGSKSADDTKITPLVLGRLSLPSSFPQARAAPFRLERRHAASCRSISRSRSSIQAMDLLMQAPLQPSSRPPSISGALHARFAMPSPGSC